MAAVLWAVCMGRAGESDGANVAVRRGLRGEPASRNHVGTISLAVATLGAVAARLVQRHGVGIDAFWMDLITAGFDAAMVGGLADWFAVTALFRHPLGLPIPHTAIIAKRRAKIIDSIASMVQDEWLSPAVLGARLQKVAPGELLLDWLEAPEHVERLGAPVRDLLRAVARLLNDPALSGFVERTLQRELRAVPLDASAGGWLLRFSDSDASRAAFESAARSIANLAQQPQTAEALQTWLDRAADQLHADGKRLIPLVLRRKVVQRKLVEAACDYAAVEFAAAAADPQHQLRSTVFGAVRRFGERLAHGDARAIAQLEQVRAAVVDSLETRPLIGDLLGRLQQQVETELTQDGSRLSAFVDEQLRRGILDWLRQPANRDSFDDWVRSTATDLLQRNHHQIGLTVRENLEALETDALVAQIEARVGSDLQFIRLNGALVGGLIGILLALLHHLI